MVRVADDDAGGTSCGTAWPVGAGPAPAVGLELSSHCSMCGRPSVWGLDAMRLDLGIVDEPTPERVGTWGVCDGGCVAGFRPMASSICEDARGVRRRGSREEGPERVLRPPSDLLSEIVRPERKEVGIFAYSFELQKFVREQKAKLVKLVRLSWSGDKNILKHSHTNERSS